MSHSLQRKVKYTYANLVFCIVRRAGAIGLVQANAVRLRTDRVSSPQDALVEA